MGCTGSRGLSSSHRNKGALRNLKGCNIEISTIKGVSSDLGLSYVGSSMQGKNYC